ncbi:uncharacterized protein LOC125655314 isoform X2 [Ostrea edulis]|uniref:uncharacterized protein LOC125655314 isoform X2 n=1 Tax=Ostrea edulis TaxID=37623 RepID=UPI0024AEDA37|nr:uncharacterized protein LOC125655314 isoform X2 [Ostrea edulis]
MHPPPKKTQPKKKKKKKKITPSLFHYDKGLSVYTYFDAIILLCFSSLSPVVFLLVGSLITYAVSGKKDCSCTSICPEITTQSSTAGTTESAMKGCEHCPSLSTSTSFQVTTSETSSTFASKSPRVVTSPEGVIGAAIGGFLLGSVVTAVVFICHRRTTLPQQKRGQIPREFHNAEYQSESSNTGAQSQSNRRSVVYSEISDETRKSMAVEPFRRQQNDSEATDDGVYNHLNEAATVDNSDYYDHTENGSSSSTPIDGYGVVTFTNREEVNDPEVNFMVAGIDRQIPNEEPVNDGYCVLEKINAI